MKLHLVGVGRPWELPPWGTEGQPEGRQYLEQRLSGWGLEGEDTLDILNS